MGRCWRLDRGAVSIRGSGHSARAAPAAVLRRGRRGAALRPRCRAAAYVPVAAVAGDPGPRTRARAGAVRPDDAPCRADAGRRGAARAARRALAQVDLAVDDARRAAEPERGALTIGYGPFSRSLVTRIVAAVAARRPDLELRLEEGVAPELVGRVATGEFAAAAMLATPAAARRHGVRVDALRDEPLLAALPATHRYANAGAIPIGAFAAERVLLPREPAGRAFNAWLRAVVRAAGFELERTLETMSAPWDRRMLPVADGAAVSVFVAEWTREAIPGVAAVAFDPPLTFPVDLATGADGSDP